MTAVLTHLDPRGQAPHRAHDAAETMLAANYRLVQVDSVFVGIITAAGTFLPVFLLRLGASGAVIGLLTSLPALTGFLVGIPIGRWLQGRGDIVRWYSRMRLLAWLSYASMGLAAAVLPREMAVPALLIIWALASLPSTAGIVAFPIVMDGAAGPAGRFDLLGRRWAIAGTATSVAVVVAGQLLGLTAFPANFELLFGAFTLAGLGSFAMSRRIVLPDQPRPLAETAAARSARVRAFVDLVRAQTSFVRFELRALIYTAGIGLATPLLPLLYVREIHAPDSWIGVIGAAQSAGGVAGYLVARRLSRRRGGAAVLLPSMLTAALVPAVMGTLSLLPTVAVLAFVGGVATAGTQLALFDALMQRIPRLHGVTFTSIDQSVQNLGLIVAPSLGGVLALAFGVRVGLGIATVVSLAGVGLFLLEWRAARRGSRGLERA